MRWLNAFNLVGLLLIATALAAWNIWISAERSTIPLALDANVASLEVRREKHPGKDDVYLLQLEPPRSLVVDQAVLQSVTAGDHLKKEAWAESLQIGDQNVPLNWSRDARGLVIAMPLLLVIHLLAAGGALVSRRK